MRNRAYKDIIDLKPGKQLDPTKDFLELIDDIPTSSPAEKAKPNRYHTSFGSFDDVKLLREAYESTQTSLSFLLVLLALLLNLFCVIALIALTGMSVATEDNLQKLLESANSTSVVDLRQPSVLFIFLVQAAVCAFSIRLIFFSYHEEIWFYIRPGYNNGKLLLKSLFVGQTCNMAF